MAGVLGAADCTEIYKGSHGRKPKDLVNVLKSIDLKAAKVQGGEALSEPPDERVSVIVETSADRMRFDLRLRRSELVLGDRPYSHQEVPAEQHYVVVEIHQHP